MPELIGKILGRVRIDMFIAQGGMAEVYLGTHTTLQRAVAVKLMKSSIQNDPDLQERFQREARVVAMLRHPNIVQVFDFDTYQGQPYLVMEFISGTPLANILRKLHERREHLSLQQTAVLVNKLADALTYAHDKGVIHRDVKPGNILLTSRTQPVTPGAALPVDTEPVLTDFGLVRFRQSTTQTATGVITGTPAYMSPEQARGSKIDSRTDVYSLGVTVYEMLAGRVPFDADSTLTVLHMHIHEPPPLIEGLAPELQGVILRALAKDPEERFRTPNEFARALHTALTGSADAPTLITPPPQSVPRVTQAPIAPPSQPGPNPRKWLPAFLGAVLTGLIGFFVVMGSNNPSIQTPAALPTEALTDESTGPHHSNSPEPDIVPNTGNGEPEQVVGVLRFQDGTAPADQVTLSTSEIPPPPEGSQYEAWLIEQSGEQRRSIGIITFDDTGQGSLTFVDTMGRNLLTLYHGVEITIEPNPDSSPNPSNTIAFQASLPSGGLTHVRHLLSGFGGAPYGKALVRGLKSNAELLNASALAMLASFEAGGEAEVRLQAESMLNLIVGSQSPEYRDWNGDGTVLDPGDGYGMLLNGENAGYIQGVYSHADFALTSPDATQNMIDHGDHVKVSAANVSEWTPLLRDQLMIVAGASFGPEMEAAVRQSVALANQILNGIDTNGNERIEPIPGEGGALTAYSHAYYMADLTIHTPNGP